jgi:hypothetical protein
MPFRDGHKQQVVSKPQIAFEGKAPPDEKAQHIQYM